jgi:hypothetical protein
LHPTLSMKGIQPKLINIRQDYKVVIHPYSYHHIIMKLIILRLELANKPSPMSEGVAEIRINSQPCKGINLTTLHMQARRAPRVATIDVAVKETIRAHLTLVHIFHSYASMDTPWVAHALLSLRIPYVPYVSGHFKCLFIRTQPMWALIDTGGGYHLGAPNL